MLNTVGAVKEHITTVELVLGELFGGDVRRFHPLHRRTFDPARFRSCRRSRTDAGLGHLLRKAVMNGQADLVDFES